MWLHFFNVNILPAKKRCRYGCINQLNDYNSLTKDVRKMKTLAFLIDKMQSAKGLIRYASAILKEKVEKQCI